MPLAESAPETAAPPAAAKLQSSLDVADRRRIAGWLFQPSSPEERLAVQIFANGKILGRIVADAYRPDLEKAEIGDGRHSFEFRLNPGMLAPDISYEIDARRESDGVPLTHSPKILPAEASVPTPASGTDNSAPPSAPLEAASAPDDDRGPNPHADPSLHSDPGLAAEEAAEYPSPDSPPFGPAPVAICEPDAAAAAPGAEPASPPEIFTDPPTVGLGRLDGSLDVVARDSVSGWALNEADPHLPVGLVVSADGRIVARVLANRFREDLRKAKIGDGNHGFELMFPELSALAPHEVHVTREADGMELPGSPKIIPAAKSFDADAETGIARILTGLDEDSEARALEFLARQTELLLDQRVSRDTGRAARHRQYLFRRRWGKIAGFDADPATKEEKLAPRALVIDDYVPDPGRDAGSVAILSHMRALTAIGFEVTFVAASDMDDRGAMDALAERAGVKVCGLPHYYSVEDVLKRQAGLFDAVYLHRISNARKYMMLVRTYQTKARVAYSVADLHHVRLARQGEVERLDALARMSEQLAIEEFTAARQADAVITHSQFEAGLLARRVPPAKVHVVPWAVEPRPGAAPFSARHGLAMIGHFAHKPNPDSVFWLLRHVMPLVWEKDPTIRCAIVGHGWSDDHLPRRDDRIDVVGPTPDLRDIFDRVRVTVASLRFGAGIKGKVLESFAAGIPCVMSPIAAEGIVLPPLVMELVAGTAQATADAILRYHSDEAANMAAAQAALEMIARDFSEQIVRDSMARALPLPQTEISGAERG